eukprot:sb/3476678/
MMGIVVPNISLPRPQARCVKCTDPASADHLRSIRAVNCLFLRIRHPCDAQPHVVQLDFLRKHPMRIICHAKNILFNFIKMPPTSPVWKYSRNIQESSLHTLHDRLVHSIKGAESK